jgi:hypothetical protein
VPGHPTTRGAVGRRGCERRRRWPRWSWGQMAKGESQIADGKEHLHSGSGGW